MRHTFFVLLLFAGTLVLPSGCGEQTLPETKPGTSRAFMENPLGAAKAAKEAKESAKAKAAQAIADKADPRGH